MGPFLEKSQKSRSRDQNRPKTGDPWLSDTIPTKHLQKHPLGYPIPNFGQILVPVRYCDRQVDFGTLCLGLFKIAYF